MLEVMLGLRSWTGREPQVRSSTCKSSVAITAMDVFNKIIGREQYMLGLQRFVTP